MSNLAPACPNCGRPMDSSTRGGAQTVEATGKWWKGIQAVGIAALFFGIVIGGVGADQGNTGAAVTGAVLGLGGLGSVGSRPNRGMVAPRLTS